MPRQHKRHIISVRLRDQEQLRLARVCEAAHKSTSEFVLESISKNIDRYEKYANKDKEDEIKDEISKLRLTVFHLFKEMLGVGARNLYLMSLMMTDCLPMEVRALSEEDSKRLFAEATSYAAGYIESLDKEYSGRNS